MKLLKYLIVVFLFFILGESVFADVMPYYTGALNKQTVGFINLPQQFDIYLYPREDSLILESVSWSKNEVKFLNTAMEPREVFSVFKPGLSLAYCMVLDEHDGWYKIIFDKQNGKTGWVKTDTEDDYLGLRNFMSYYGKKYGLEYMKNVDYHKRGIYSGAYNESQKLGGFTMIKNIKLHKISGNWALVTVVDIDSKPKIGYIRWRDDDGSIIVFPKIKN